MKLRTGFALALVLVLGGCQDRSDRIVAPELSPGASNFSTSYIGGSYGLADDIGHLGYGASHSPMIADNGYVAGYMQLSADLWGMARWMPSSGLQSIPHAANCNATWPTGITATGTVVGTAQNCQNNPMSTGYQRSQAFRWNGGYEMLSTPNDPYCESLGGYSSSWGQASNSIGVVAGLLAHCRGSLLAVWHPDGTAEFVALPSGTIAMEVRGINELNQVTGYISSSDALGQGFLWSLAGGFQRFDMVPVELNNNGTVIGNAPGGVHRWTASIGLQNLGLFFDGATNVAVGVSDNEEVIIIASGRTYRWTPFEGMQDIGLMPNAPTITPGVYARAVNSAGVITGSGSVVVDGMHRGHAFRWTVDHGFEDLGTVNGTGSRGESINSSGQVAGFVFGQEAGHRWTRWRGADTSPPPPGDGAPEAEINGPYTGQEGSPVSFSSAGTTDSNGSVLTYLWDLGDGNTSTDANPSHTYLDNGGYTVRLTVTNSNGESDAATTSATISNVAPSVGAISGLPIDPIPVGTGVSLSVSFTDPGILDTHTALINWDVEGSPTFTSGTVDDYAVSGSHTYLAAGVYTVQVTVTDKDGDAGESPLYEYVAVYDPSEGYVAGNGTIHSPAGSLLADPTHSGTARFALISRYRPGAAKPSGNTHFQIQTVQFRFQSTNYEWLVVSGPKAQYKGSGTINGAGDFGFLLTANDGSVQGGGGVDRLRLKVWDKVSGEVVYDNQRGDSDTADATTALTSGRIEVRRK